MTILKVKDINGNWVDIPAIVGPQGPRGPQGPKGDDATYTLPTASVEVKGGVKINPKHFVMDGDVLGVAPNVVYELIESITLEEAAIFKMTQEPNGTPLKLKSIIARMLVPAGMTTSAGTTCYYRCNGGAVAYIWYGGITTANTKDMKRIDKVSLEGGYWVSEWVDWQTANDAAFKRFIWKEYLMGKNEKSQPYIDEIDIRQTLPAGTTIEIWGVRA